MEEKIKAILKELCNQSIEDVSLTLTNDLLLDSLQMVTLLILLEEKFEIELEEADMDPFALITVKDVISLAEKYHFKEEKQQHE